MCRGVCVVSPRETPGGPSHWSDSSSYLPDTLEANLKKRHLGLNLNPEKGVGKETTLPASYGMKAMDLLSLMNKYLEASDMSNDRLD